MISGCTLSKSENCLKVAFGYYVCAEKSRQAPGTPMSDIMKALGKKWTEKQSQQKPGTHPAGKALFPSSSEDSIDLTGGDNGESRITETVVLDFFKLTL